MSRYSRKVASNSKERRSPPREMRDSWRTECRRARNVSYPRSSLSHYPRRYYYQCRNALRFEAAIASRDVRKFLVTLGYCDKDRVASRLFLEGFRYLNSGAAPPNLKTRLLERGVAPLEVRAFLSYREQRGISFSCNIASATESAARAPLSLSFS